MLRGPRLELEPRSSLSQVFSGGRLTRGVSCSRLRERWKRPSVAPDVVGDGFADAARAAAHEAIDEPAHVLR